MTRECIETAQMLKLWHLLSFLQLISLTVLNKVEPVTHKGKQQHRDCFKLPAHSVSVQSVLGAAHVQA